MQKYRFSVCVGPLGMITPEGYILEFEDDSAALEYERATNELMANMGVDKRFYCLDISLEKRLGFEIVSDATIDDLFGAFEIDKDS